MQISNEEYEMYKPLLFSLGYRMTGSVSDTEDIMQDTFLKAYQLPETDINNKKAYLCKMMTNRCIDFLKSARVKREQYVGPWHPEPFLQEENDPSVIMISKEYMSIAYLRMMEHLTPHERAVVLLREVFHFSYKEIAGMIGKSEENCRKLLSRTKQKLTKVENESLNYEKNKSLIQRFIHAFETGSTEDLLKLVSDQVTLYSDGGGKVKAATRPIISSAKVLAFLHGINSKMPADFHTRLESANGQPCLVNYAGNTLHSTISFYICNDKIHEIYLTMNPEKLPETVTGSLY
ncbi:RNA polymerase sigma-70 factor, ECF subfamily [Gracilibacillus ureilyticus]|uniref:RNA polymerase sigma-70 factor, ECF subfamily n=1 Tax=Gracilibacillus ureilyticus TaxID=531814 RepID=A0A1H9MR91_9BACI|nr:RNA polymerase sigma-70 factor [Gracilibacillus ureilyticus]SER25673.1 RNA polymerase sigma-70 factor, ECF subfamily [Gracilibacillus ureilyticus]